MAILQQKPVTPSGRFYFKNKVELSKKRPEKSLTSGFHRKKGRNTKVVKVKFMNDTTQLRKWKAYSRRTVTRKTKQ